MAFSDLLKKPLPSSEEDSLDTMLESVLEEEDDPEVDEFDPGEGSNANEGCCKEDSDDDDDVDDDEINSLVSDDLEDDDDFDPDDYSDEELAELDRELTGDAYDTAGSNEEEVHLTPDEEMEADDMMSIAATTSLINREMNADEKKKFVESATDVQIALNEGLLLESDVTEIMQDCGLVTEGKNYNKKMIIRLDKESKMKQLYALGINVSAAAHKDPDYIALKKLNRVRKIKKAKLRKKYHAEAMKRMKIYYKRLTSSKSAPLSALGKKLSGK